MQVRPYQPSDRHEWLRMRLNLWPEGDSALHLSDMDAWLARADAVVLVVARVGESGLAGFAEIGARSIAESCETSPVAYLEGWYVDPDVRRQGIGTALVRAAEAWARARGLREFGSDAQLHNVDSQQAHVALGFIEVERAVLYRKVL